MTAIGRGRNDQQHQPGSKLSLEFVGFRVAVEVQGSGREIM